MMARNRLRIEQRVVVVLLGFLVFAFSFAFSPYSRNGDQVFYSRAYDAVRGLSLAPAFGQYLSIINSQEPMHFLISWVGSNIGLNKNMLMSAINSALAVSCAIYLYHRTGRFWLSMLFVVCNYYLYALYFTLEKLKIAFLFFILFLSIDKKKIIAWLFLLASILAHFQMVLISIAILAGMIMRQKRFSIKPRLILLTILLISVITVIFISASSYIILKFKYYIHAGVKPEIFKMALLGSIAGLTIWLSDERKFAFGYFSALAFIILLLGGDRLNMFFFLGAIVIANSRNQVNRMVLNIVNIYLSYKTITYLNMIYLWGG